MFRMIQIICLQLLFLLILKNNNTGQIIASQLNLCDDSIKLIYTFVLSICIMKCKQKFKSGFQTQNIKLKTTSNFGAYGPQDKPKDIKKKIEKSIPRIVSKSARKTHQKSFKNTLFISAQYLPLKKESSNQNASKRNKKNPLIGYGINSKADESTASRQFRMKQNEYNYPNTEYFGASVSSLTPTLQRKHKNNSKIKPKNQTKNKTHHPSSSSAKLLQSLKKKINKYSRLDSEHKSESESLKSQVSEKQMRRLRKIQSIQKLRLAEDIITIEKRLLKHRI